MNSPRVVVFGPAYLDRILRVNRPLLADDQGSPIDQSVEAEGKFGDGRTIEVVFPEGPVLEILPPPGWPGPWGEVRLRSPLRVGLKGRRSVQGIDWLDDLGGMGAGYAAALGGPLYSALGAEDDPTSGAVSERLSRYGVSSRPVRVAERTADWTLLITSGEFGDKLPIGFRGCHDALRADDLARGGIALRPARGRRAFQSTGRARPRGRGGPHAVSRAGHAEHDRSGTSPRSLRRSRRYPELQPDGVGGTRRSVSHHVGYSDHRGHRWPAGDRDPVLEFEG